MKLTIRNLIFAASLLTVAACSKKEVEPITTNKPETNVYIAGYVFTSIHTTLAAYWKNGTMIKLVNDSTIISYAHNIIANGNDIHVTGLIFPNSGSQPVYWKNGVMTTLSGVSGVPDVLSLAVNGNDVYIAGKLQIPTSTNSTSIPAYWKNGVPQTLQYTSGDRFLDITSIAVVGNDVYVAGAVRANGITSIAAFWKNGVLTKLQNSTPSQNSYATGIAVQGDVVYISGISIADGGGYWKNGIFNKLTPDLTISSIAVKGNDVYVGGTKSLSSVSFDYKPTYWKNGMVGNEIGNSVNHPQGSAVNQIALHNDDVYAIGAFNTSKPSYWKNNALVQFTTNSTAVGVGIWVVSK